MKGVQTEPDDLPGYPEILKPRHVMEILGESRDTVYRLFNSSHFPSERFGKTGHFIPKSRLLRWMSEPMAEEFRKGKGG